jgi:hypothetical protein
MISSAGSCAIRAASTFDSPLAAIARIVARLREGLRVRLVSALVDV